MSTKYIFRIFFQSIDFEKETPNNQSYSFSLMNGFKEIGSVTNVSILPKSKHQSLQNLPSLAFEYDYVKQIQEDCIVQLGINDETQYNQQIDNYPISVLRLVYYFNNNKQEKKMSEDWMIHDGIAIKFYITKQEKNFEELQNQTNKKRKSSQKNSLGMIGSLFETLEKQKKPVNINRNASITKVTQQDKMKNSLKSSMKGSILLHHRNPDLLRTSRMEQPLPKHHQEKQHHHDHSQKISLRMKIVIAMLIFGFLFLCFETVKFNMKFKGKKLKKFKSQRI